MNHIVLVVVLNCIDNAMFYALFMLSFEKRLTRLGDAIILCSLLGLQLAKNLLPVSEAATIGINAALGLAAAAILFCGKLPDLIYSLLLFFVLMFLSEAAAYAVFNVLWSSFEAYGNEQAYFFLMVLSRALLPPIILCFRKLYRKKIYPGVDNKGVQFLLFVPVPSLICAVMLIYFPYINTKQPPGLFYLSMLGLLVALVYIMLLASQYVKERNMSDRLDRLNRHQEDSRNYFKTLDKSLRTVLGTIHDISKHLDYLSNPCNEGYISGLRDRLSFPGDTGNHDIDAILHGKYKSLPKGVTLNVTGILPPFLPWLDTPDIVSLLGNALDNAIEAAANLPYDIGKVVTAAFGYDGNSLVIRIQNPYTNKLIPAPRGLYRSGRDTPGHGYGLINMRAVTDKYNGMLDIRTDAGNFTVTVILQGGENKA